MAETSFGRYRLLELLGQGGMGQVFRAYDTETDREVALKVLAPQVASDETFQQRFRREAHLAARVNDPHVVPIHSYGEIDGRLYVDMRLVEGRDLGSVLAEGALDPARAVRIVEQVAEALDAAHATGLVHRDIKPSNILLGNRDFVYLIDFGIARQTDATRLTSTGAAIGTFAYMAPERFETGDGGPGIDIYALACVLHECLTGRSPYGGGSMEQQIAGHLTKPPPRPSESGVPPGFDEVVAVGMAKDPAQRFQSGVALAEAARGVTDGRPAGHYTPPTLMAATQLAPTHASPVPQAAPPSNGWPAPQHLRAGRPYVPPSGLPGERSWRRPANFIVAGILIMLAAVGRVVAPHYYVPSLVEVAVESLPWLVFAVAFALIATSVRAAGVRILVSAMGVCCATLMAAAAPMASMALGRSTWLAVISFVTLLVISSIAVFGIMARPVFRTFGLVASLMVVLWGFCILARLIVIWGRYWNVVPSLLFTNWPLLLMSISMVVLGIAVCRGRIPKIGDDTPSHPTGWPPQGVPYSS